MRCVDVTRELSAPTGDRQSSALAQHLAACPQCAAWAARDMKLNQLWDATRPVEPSTEVWNEVWTEISARLDRPDVLPFREAPTIRPGRRILMITLGVAQAAAILLAVFFFTRAPGGPQPDATVHQPVRPVDGAPPSSVAQSDSDPLDIDPDGSLVVLRIEAPGKVEKTEVALNDNSGRVDSGFEMLNFLESAAKQ